MKRGSPSDPAPSADRKASHTGDGGLFSGALISRVPVQIGSDTLMVHTIADLDSLLERKLAHEPIKTCPFGGVLWPSSLALCNWLVSPETAAHPAQRLQSKMLYDEIANLLKAPAACLELGCGVGLAGLLLARTFGCRALLTDFEPSLHHLVQLNAREFSCTESIDFAVLDWMVGPDAELLQLAQKTPMRLLIAADVLYEQQHITAVPAIAAKLMRETGAELFILADPERYCYESAFSELRARFRSVERITLELSTSQSMPQRVHLHFCKVLN
jgi:hypothetical protein